MYIFFSSWPKYKRLNHNLHELFKSELSYMRISSLLFILSETLRIPKDYSNLVLQVGDEEESTGDLTWLS